jgi:hypothetical protein
MFKIRSIPKICSWPFELLAVNFGEDVVQTFSTTFYFEVSSDETWQVYFDYQRNSFI